MADVVAIGLRGLSFAAALQAAGAAAFVWLFGHLLDRASRRVGAMAVRTAIVGLLLTLAYAAVEPARLAGEMRGIFDGALQALLLASDGGTAAAVRVLGLGLVAGGSLRPGRAGSAAALIGAAVVVASFAFVGHTAADDRRWLLAPLLLAHLAAVAFWLGALWPLSAAARHEPAAVGGAVIEAFSRLAIRLVPIILVAGVAMAALLLPDLASLRTPYGFLLTAKVSAFAILMGLAAANRRRLGPDVARGNRAAVRVFRIVVSAEWALIVGVVMVTAAMTGLYSPEN